MKCAVETCDRQAKSRGWCHTHYAYWRNHGYPEPPAKSQGCSVDDCERDHYARSWCRLHWDRWYRHGDPLYEPPAVPVRVCQVEDCQTRARTRGLCGKHYQRKWKTGDPEKMRIGTLEERFWAKVDRRSPDECWEWSGGYMQHGYGRFTIPGKRHGRAHVYSYELAHGPVPTGLNVLHSCDNPPCCNPSHLSAGTQAENMDQMVQRGRKRRKFTDEEMSAIRDSPEMQRDLAKRYGISQSYVSLIKRQYRDGMNRSFTA